MKFSGLQALNKIDLHVEQGEIVGLIGPNGSGKSTWMNCVVGILRPTSGRVLFDGRDVTGKPPSEMYKAGVGRTFQLLENFPDMSVMDNLLLAVQESEGNMARRLFRFTEARERARAEDLLAFLGIGQVKQNLVKTVSYGQQKLCDLAMALMADPEILLLDEPMAGINPTLILDIVDRIQELNRRGKTFLIIEHNMSVVMSLCTRIVVFDFGEKIAEGTPAEVQSNPAVQEAYFGSATDLVSYGAP